MHLKNGLEVKYKHTLSIKMTKLLIWNRQCFRKPLETLLWSYIHIPIFSLTYPTIVSTHIVHSPPLTPFTKSNLTLPLKNTLSIL